MTKQRTALHHNIPGTSRQQTARQDQKGRHLPHTMRRSDANLHLSSRRSIRALGVLRYESPSHDSDTDSRGRKESQRKKRTRKRRKKEEQGSGTCRCGGDEEDRPEEAVPGPSCFIPSGSLSGGRGQPLVDATEIRRDRREQLAPRAVDEQYAYRFTGWRRQLFA